VPVKGGWQNAAVVDDLSPGLYEQLVSVALAERLRAVDGALVRRSPLRPADAADRIGQHLARQIVRIIEAVPDTERVRVGVEVACRIVDELMRASPRADVAAATPLPPGEVLSAIGERRPDGGERFPGRPLIPLVDTTLLTNAPGEPRVGSQLLAEIESSDAIDLVMAFVRRSGLLPFAAALRAHCDRGRQLRVLTTTYTGSTEAGALDLLADLGAQVRVSYDTSGTRLHAKAWVFHRHTAFGTAYVGSSNLTHSAQMAGMEWNVRVSGARNPDVLDKIQAVFDSYWESGDFVQYVPQDFRNALAAQQRGRDSGAMLSPIEIRLEPFQERLLELIAVSRRVGHHRNLLVSATGTGKTVMAAVDYARLRAELPRARLLFVAHRQEILDQSLATFRHALRDHAFGERWVGGSTPEDFEHVFASIQSLTARGLAHLAPDHFDVVIVDEFHHAAARTYGALLGHLRPRELLGLTATPERSDGLSILHWFDDRIAAELRLWDAIEQQRLVPFVYYGIHDGIDLREVPWRRGQGYDVQALSALYTSNGAWARFVYHQLQAHVDDPSAMRCFGFCVSVAHAQFMAAEFQSLGVAAVALSASSSDEDRRAALRDLDAGRVQVVFSVDLFNEGVDVPTVDVVLMMRPTESATLFLQQLGRGLRKAPGKATCTVLDLVGTHRREFRLDLRYRALLGGSRADLERAVRDGFPYLPAGCHLELDRVASEVVLRSIRDAIPTRWTAKVGELRALYGGRGRDVTITEYLSETGLEVGDLYAGDSGHCWSALREQAGLPVAPSGPHETVIRRGIARVLHVDDRQRTSAYRSWLAQPKPPIVDGMSPMEARLMRMLVANVAGQVLGNNDVLQSAVDVLWAHPQVRDELNQLLGEVGAVPSHLPHAALPDVPLQIHTRYTRSEILAAVGEGAAAKTPQWREGVYNAKGIGADLLAFTLDKTSGDFSPTTRYRDYAINRELIHWESQSTTRADSPTGLRYRNHATMGSSILLFARTRRDERAFWFLGPASYLRHEREQPMAITWRLHTALPGDLYAAFAAAVA
jgi:superfamily II DNA or RNA helicase/HKD family nuclease